MAVNVLEAVKIRGGQANRMETFMREILISRNDVLSFLEKESALNRASFEAHDALIDRVSHDLKALSSESSEVAKNNMLALAAALFLAVTIAINVWISSVPTPL